MTTLVLLAPHIIGGRYRSKEQVGWLCGYGKSSTATEATEDNSHVIPHSTLRFCQFISIPLENGRRRRGGCCNSSCVYNYSIYSSLLDYVVQRRKSFLNLLAAHH